LRLSVTGVPVAWVRGDDDGLCFIEWLLVDSA
jgi:hypothetical protein